MFGLVRRHPALLATLLASLCLAGLVMGANGRAESAARAAQRADRVRTQVMLAGLTRQYLRFTFLEVERAAEQPWTLRPAAPADTHGLQQWVQSSPLHFAGAALTDLTGRPLSTSGEVVAGTDLGFVPLRAELLAGRPGLSALLQSGRGHPLVAIALPVRRAGTPTGLFVAFASPAVWSLQGYTATLNLGEHGTYAIVDQTGRATATNVPSLIGTRLLTRPVERPELWTQNSDLVSATPVGVAGWISLTRQPARDFYAPLGSARRWVLPTLAVLLGLLIATMCFAEVRRHRALTQLAEQAIFDPLTGAATRRLLDLRLSALVNRHRRDNSPAAVLFCDLDGFKTVNDTHGHAVGDEVLKETVHRLRTELRDEDFLARVGGDEFVIVVEGFTDPALLEELASRLVRAVQQPIPSASGLQIAISIGVTGLDGTSPDADRLLERADVAMYQAKKAGCGYMLANSAPSPARS